MKVISILGYAASFYCLFSEKFPWQEVPIRDIGDIFKLKGLKD